MNEPSMVSSRLIPAANSSGSDSNAQNGRPDTTAVPDSDQQGNLCRGIEAQPEQEADGIHLPWRIDAPGHGSEEAVHQAAVVELTFQLLVVEYTPAHGNEQPHDRHQNNDIQDGNQIEECPRDRRADQAGVVMQVGAGVG